MKIYILFLTVFIFFSACHKSDEPAVLKPTQSGQNVIAFTVNGQQHVYMGIPTFSTPGISFSIIRLRDSSMIIDMDGTGNYHDGFEFVTNIVRFSLSNVYHIGNNYPYYQSYYNDNSNGQGDIFYPDSSKSTFIFTRLDSSVAAGVFQFYGIDNNGQTISLSNGFFDIANPFK
ncbi:MAG: hypothetical protein ACTHJ0_05725 [Flavipsychrobacter sp.]